MEIRQRQALTKVFIWLVAETMLGFAGLDDLADYSELIFERNTLVFIG